MKPPVIVDELYAHKQARKPIKVWVAVGPQGHVAPFLGFAFTAKSIREDYSGAYGATLEQDGYRLVKAWLVLEDK